jgi:alpha-1,6-mannosyltransferase
VNIALYKLWNRAPNAVRPTARSVDLAIALLCFTAVVFRAEVALLLASLVLQVLWLGYVPISRVIKVGFISSLVSVGKPYILYSSLPHSSSWAALTVLVDSYLWQKWPLWAELYGIYFNVVQGKSADWGVRDKIKNDDYRWLTELFRSHLSTRTLLHISRSSF